MVLAVSGLVGHLLLRLPLHPQPPTTTRDPRPRPTPTERQLRHRLPQGTQYQDPSNGTSERRILLLTLLGNLVLVLLMLRSHPARQGGRAGRAVGGIQRQHAADEGGAHGLWATVVSYISMGIEGKALLRFDDELVIWVCDVTCVPMYVVWFLCMSIPGFCHVNDVISIYLLPHNL